MTNTKSIAKKILEEYANYYSQVDLEQLTVKLDQLKAEAIKEFAERLKKIDFYQFIEEYYENAELCYEVRQDWIDAHIDNLVKEMVGE